MSAFTSFTAAPSALRVAGRVRRNARRAPVAVRAVQSKPASESVKLAEQFGFTGVEEGLFGFRPFPELWVGRLAMLGFATGSTVELLTGVPTLQQLGLDTPNSDLFTVLCILLGTATAIGTGRTLYRLQSGDMALKDFKRYAGFFGLDAERVAEKESSQRKKSGDFTSRDSIAAITEAKEAGSPADALLMASDAAAGAVQEEAAPVEAPAAPRMTADEIERAYARDIELSQGRYAMLGFVALILGEAATGNGLVGQLEAYAKLFGLLGAESGF